MSISKIISYLVFLSISSSVYSVDIYVSPNGNDSNAGTPTEPKATLHGAIREAREYRRLLKVGKDEPIRILMKGGIYNLYEPIFIRPEDSGTESSPTIIQAIEGEDVALSSGLKIDGWKKQGKSWVADVPDFNGNRLIFRQLWVNGIKATRARNISEFEKMDRIRSNDKVNEVLWVPASAVKGLTKAGNLELVIHQMWAIANLRVKSVTIQGDSAGIRFHNPESRIQFEHPWPQPMVQEGVNSAFYLTNALELLDEPGEWHHDTKTNKLYYIPREGENMATAEVVVPTLETLVEIIGTIDRPVEHIHFKNINFNYTTWIRPSLMGHVPLQGGMYLLDAYKLRPAGVPGNFNKGIENQAWIGCPPAALMAKAAKHISVDACRFEHLGSAGVDFVDAVHHSEVRGSLFRDIAGNGLQIGRFSEVSLETHLPYDPIDQREICSHISIKNNYITNVTNEDWGCLGILAGFVRDLNISHNEISEIAYSGISLGWGWTKTVNCMRNNIIHANYIHHYAKHMYDVAGIYTLSVQPKSAITENRVEEIYSPSYVHDPEHWFYLYTDEGSSFIEIKDNWTPSEKYLKNANGPGNTWENNGPMVADSIKQKAGLEKQYQWLKTLK